MEDKIEVNEYVRTEDGRIGIFIRYSSRPNNSIHKSPFNCFIKLQNRKNFLQCHREYIIKHSKNLIDLIESGDYVNGKYVYDVFENANGEKVVKVDCMRGYIYQYEIEEIVTHEQFEQMKYKVEG